MKVVGSHVSTEESVRCGLGCCHEGCAGSETHFSWMSFSVLSQMEECFLPLSRQNLKSYSNNSLELQIYAFERRKLRDLPQFNVGGFQESTCSREGYVHRCLRFLSCVSAKYCENARITGIDTFEHVSLKRSSLQGAKENTRILGFSHRIDFKRDNAFRFAAAEKFDIIVSNLVFHNFGKMHFKAYFLLSSWTQADSFVIIGDLFFSPKTDIAHLEKAFRILRQIEPKNGFGQYTLLVMSRDPRQVSTELTGILVIEPPALRCRLTSLHLHHDVVPILSNTPHRRRLPVSPLLPN